MTWRPAPKSSANPGLPGFARFWVRDIARSADLGRTTRNPASGRMGLEKFPAGNFGLSASAAGPADPGAAARWPSRFPSSFLQETLASTRPHVANAGEIAMPS
jgi:hypothetical protein